MTSNRNAPQVNAADDTARDLAMVMFETAVLRSGFTLPDSAGFADRVDRMLRLSMDISVDEAVSCGEGGGGGGGLHAAPQYRHFCG